MVRCDVAEKRLLRLRATPALIAERMQLTRLFMIAMSLCVGCSALSHKDAPPPPLHKISEIRYVMGTLLEVTIFAPSKQEGREILNETFKVGEHLDNVLSTWKPESPVSRFNRDRSITLRPVDPDLYALVDQARQLAEKTDNAFTIGVRPLVEMWESAARTGIMPSPSAVARVKNLITPSKILSSPPSNLGKGAPGVRIETGGIGKGYAVDAMRAYLTSRGIEHAFINLGRSSIAAIGAPPGASGWKIELALTDTSSEGTIELRDETLSVSRAKGTPFVVNGVQYAHIFDPRTGTPVSTSRGAAIRGRSATEGEAFVKYLVIRGAPPAHVAATWGDVDWIVRHAERVERTKGFEHRN
ncbi:MAG: hypothetical protein RL518_224 [Pseudomonadota bacterium]